MLLGPRVFWVRVNGKMIEMGRNGKALKCPLSISSPKYPEGYLPLLDQCFGDQV